MATPRQVVIDDTDSRVIYSGEGWFQDNGSLNTNSTTTNGLPYNRTSHGTTSPGNLSFTFEGTSITLYGTLVPVLNGMTISYECSVEQFDSPLSPPRTSSTINNWAFCQFDQLFDGRHTFYASNMSPGMTFWIDRLEYTPSPQASFDEVVLKVDRADARINLDSNWRGSDDGKMTSTKGSKARFEFVGKSVTWVGFIPIDVPQSPASASFSIDGGPFQSFTLDRLPNNWMSTVRDQEFFTTPVLEPGPHSLVVAYNGSDAGPAIPLTLEYLYVTSTNQAPLAPLSSSVSSRPIRSSVPSGQPLPSSTEPALLARGHTNLLAALIGGIVGGLALIALVALLYFWKRYRKIKKRNSGPSSVGGSSASPAEVNPFTLLQPPRLASHDSDPHLSPTPVVKPNLPLLPQPLLPPNNESATRGEEHTVHVRIQSNVREKNAGITQPTQEGLHQSQVVRQPDGDLVRHQDSGRRFLPAPESATTEVPPDYTAV